MGFFMVSSQNFKKFKKLCLPILHDLKVSISVAFLHQTHPQVVFWNSEKNYFLEFKVNLAYFWHFSLIYTGTKKKPRLLTILQKTLGKNFCKSIIFSKRSQTSKFFFERLTHPLDFFRIEYLHRHTRCRCSRWTRPKKLKKKHLSTMSTWH